MNQLPNASEAGALFFRGAAFGENLPILLEGMLCIFAVMGILILATGLIRRWCGK